MLHRSADRTYSLPQNSLNLCSAPFRWVYIRLKAWEARSNCLTMAVFTCAHYYFNLLIFSVTRPLATWPQKLPKFILSLTDIAWLYAKLIIKLAVTPLSIFAVDQSVAAPPTSHPAVQQPSPGAWPTGRPGPALHIHPSPESRCQLEEDISPLRLRLWHAEQRTWSPLQFLHPPFFVSDSWAQPAHKLIKEIIVMT